MKAVDKSGNIILGTPFHKVDMQVFLFLLKLNYKKTLENIGENYIKKNVMLFKKSEDTAEESHLTK